VNLAEEARRFDVAAQEILARDQMACIRCGLRAVDAHHRQQKSVGGLSTWDNQISLCRECHDWAHANIELATFEGWLVGSWEVPEIVPVEHYLLGRVIIGSDSTINAVGVR